MRVTATSINAPTAKAADVRKIVAGFPNLFSPTAKKYVVTQTLVNVSELIEQKGQTATPEQSLKFIDEAVAMVIQQFVQAVPEEIQKIIDENKEDILDTFVTDQTEMANGPQPIETLPPGSPTLQDMQQPAGEPQPLPDEAQHAPMAASMDPKLKYAFRGLAQQADPQVVQDTWVIVEGPYGRETVRADDVDLNEVENMLDSMDRGEQVALAGTTLGNQVANEVAWYLDITTGYGARVSNPVSGDDTAWKSFDSKNEAWDYLNGLVDDF